MKNCLLILLLFTAAKSNAQTVFAPQNSVWNYYYEGDLESSFNIKYKTEKDTFFLGKMCAKVVGEKTMISGAKSQMPTTYFYTSTDTVFYYHDSLMIFTPIYIFNVKAGDTLNLAFPPSSKFPVSFKTFKCLVTKIDTNIFDGIPLRTIKVSSLPWPDYAMFSDYTERFGGLWGANILAVQLLTTTDHREGLRCYRDNEIEEKFTTDTRDCDYVPSTIAEQNVAKLISVYPNPALQTLFVETQKPKALLFIQTIAGEIVLQKTIRSGQNTIDISSLAPGVYFIKTHCEANTYFQKLIVAK